jgi:hypothetical protein
VSALVKGIARGRSKPHAVSLALAEETIPLRNELLGITTIAAAERGLPLCAS